MIFMRHHARPSSTAFIPYVNSLVPTFHSGLFDESGSHFLYDDKYGGYNSALIRRTTNDASAALTNVSLSSSGGPIAGRGRLILATGYPTVVTGKNMPVEVQAAGTTCPNGLAFALAFKPSSSATAGSQIFSYNAYYADHAANFPFVFQHSGTLDSVTLGLSYGNDYSTDVTLTSATSSCPKNAWSYVVVRMDAWTSGNANVIMYVNGTKYSTTRSAALTVSAGRWSALGAPVYYNGGGVSSPIQFFGELAEFSFWSTNISNITDTTAANLYTKFLAGI